MKRSGRGRRLPAIGAIGASVVLLATSAAAPGEPVDPANAPNQNRPTIRDAVGPGRTADARLPSRYEASGTLENLDDAGPVIPAVFTGDIPATMLKAYQHARDLINTGRPGCHLPLELLEAIGKVETNHARNGLVDGNGTTLEPILGPALDGNGFATIPDTDGGRLDGDPVWDRAVGPMQFIPSTWANWSADGNGDHRADPNNAYDASLATARYLCAANRDLGTPQGLDEAIFSYNSATSYRNLVLAWMSTYGAGVTAVPDATALGEAPPRIPVVAVPAGNTRPAPAPAEPPASTPPAPSATSAPPAPPATPVPSAPPVTIVPVPPIIAPTAAPPAPATPAPVAPAPGLVCGLTSVVGGLLGSLMGGGGAPGCDGDTAPGQ